MRDDTIRPVPDELSQPFWEAAAQSQLELQQCLRCSRFNHPPQWVCGFCGGTELQYAPVPGAWHVASWTSAPRRARDTGPAPYTNIVVEADHQDGVLLVSQVLGERPDWVRIGAAVEPYFAALDGTGVVVPQFGPVDADG